MTMQTVATLDLSIRATTELAWSPPANVLPGDAGRIVASFVDAAATALGRATHYNSRDEQQKAELAAHEGLLRLDRGLYSLLLTLPGVLDRARQVGIKNLLSTSVDSASRRVDAWTSAGSSAPCSTSCPRRACSSSSRASGGLSRGGDSQGQQRSQPEARPPDDPLEPANRALGHQVPEQDAVGPHPRLGRADELDPPGDPRQGRRPLVGQGALDSPPGDRSSRVLRSRAGLRLRGLRARQPEPAGLPAPRLLRGGEARHQRR
jgi:hypothetical protein